MEDAIVRAVMIIMMMAVPAAQPTRPNPSIPPAHLVVESIGGGQIGKASHYWGSRGFHGIPHVAMQNGRWTGKINRYVFVTIGDLTKKLPVVDYCECWRGTKKERIIDLSDEAISLFGLDPLTGIWDVEVRDA